LRSIIVTYPDFVALWAALLAVHNRSFTVAGTPCQSRWHQLRRCRCSFCVKTFFWFRKWYPVTFNFFYYIFQLQRALLLKHFKIWRWINSTIHVLNANLQVPSPYCRVNLLWDMSVAMQVCASVTRSARTDVSVTSRPVSVPVGLASADWGAIDVNQTSGVCSKLPPAAMDARVSIASSTAHIWTVCCCLKKKKDWVGLLSLYDGGAARGNQTKSCCSLVELKHSCLGLNVEAVEFARSWICKKRK